MPPQPKPKSNLFDKLFRRKPKPTPTEIMLMSKLAELVARVKVLTDQHVMLKNHNASLAAKVAELTAQAIADDAQIAELMAMIDSAIGEGASMGGNG